MLCTVVVDQYETGDRREVWTALESLLPRDSPDWSRMGLYAYWDTESRELLYVGLATDLPTRFAQHNGLVMHSGGNKLNKIEEWFARKPSLGFTVMLQSATVQLFDEIREGSITLGRTADELIALAEGQLIELHRLEVGRRPRWNSVGGKSRGKDFAQNTGQSFIPILSGVRDSIFVARRSLRVLIGDPDALRYEGILHAARMRAVQAAHDLLDLPNPEDVSAERIEQLMLISSGHMVDNVAPADAEVIEGLRRIQDGRSKLDIMRLIRANHELLLKQTDPRALAMSLGASLLIPKGLEADDAPIVDAIFTSNYLMQVPLPL